MAIEPFLTVEEVARIVGCHPHTVRVWLQAGRLHGTRPGGERLGWRVAESEVERFLREGPREPSGVQAGSFRTDKRGDRFLIEAVDDEHRTVAAHPAPLQSEGAFAQRTSIGLGDVPPLAVRAKTKDRSDFV